MKEREKEREENGVRMGDEERKKKRVRRWSERRRGSDNRVSPAEEVEEG